VADRGGARFATTRWSLVLAAGRRSNARSTEALASLCETYWYPVYAVIRRQGYGVDEARDLTQGFFARVLEKNYFGDADPARGRFRAFLWAAIRHFLSNERDRERALKRGGAQVVVSLEVETAEGRYQLEPRDEVTPERLFDQRWALVLLDNVLARLRSSQRIAKRAMFDALKGFLTGDSEGDSYQAVGKALGLSEGAVKVAVHRMRRQFREALIAEIAGTVADPADIDGEVRHLLKALGR
jgi:RNA polymerase sigma-70 factor (ECF subfamily)